MGKAGCVVSGCRPTAYHNRHRFPKPEKFQANFQIRVTSRNSI